MQIQLMIILRIPPLPGLQDLRRNRALLPPLPLHLLRHALRLRLLLRGVVEDGAAVLGAGVHALAVRGGGVVHFVEEFEEGGVGEGGGVEGHLEGFGMSCPPRANGPVTRTTRIATDVPDPRVEQSLPFKRLAEEVLDAPETASGYGALLRVGWEVGGGAAFGVEGHAGGGGEGAEEASEEIGHC